MVHYAKQYNKSVNEEMTLTIDQLKTRHVGKQDPKKHLEDQIDNAMSGNIVWNLALLLDSVAF